MNRLFERSFMAIFCAAFLCLETGAVFADEMIPFPEIKPVEQQETSIGKLKEFLSWTEKIGYENDSAYLHRIHNDAYYHLVAYSETGDIVQLHDASQWEVQYYGRQRVLYWLQSDEIFIKPNACCLSSYRYVLNNRTKNETVEVNLVYPPLPMGAYTFRIINIEPYQRLIQLSDNTIWQIDFKDSHFSSWQIGQRVLIGVNNHWRTAQFPHAIINVDMYKEPYSQGIFYGYPVGY